MKRSFFAVLLVCALLICSLAACAKKSEPPPPELLPPLVDDRAGVISDTTAAKIEQEGAVLRDLTGAEIVVATVDFLGGKEIDQFANELFDLRQPGLEHNNGLFLLFCVGQEDYYLAAGEGLRETMNGERLLSLLDQAAETEFEAANYDVAAQKTFDLLKTEVEAVYGVSVSDEIVRRSDAAAQPPKQDMRSFLILIPIACFTLACLMFFLSYVGRRRRRRRV